MKRLQARSRRSQRRPITEILIQALPTTITLLKVTTAALIILAMLAADNTITISKVIISRELTVMETNGEVMDLPIK